VNLLSLGVRIEGEEGLISEEWSGNCRRAGGRESEGRVRRRNERMAKTDILQLD